MKRIWRIALVLACVVLLGGCVQLNIDAGVDEAHNAYLAYHVEMDVSGLDARQRADILVGMEKNASHYQKDLGFEVVDETEDGSKETFAYTFRKTVANETDEQAFAALQELLTNDAQTLFLQVEMAQTQEPHQQYYHLAAVADMGKVAALSNIAQFPPSMQKEYEQAVAQSTGTVRLTLPASEISSSSHPAAMEGKLAVMSAPLSFSQEDSYELTTLLNLTGGAYTPLSSAELESRQQQRLWGLAAIVAAGLLSAIVGFVMRRSVKKSTAQAKRSDAPQPQPEHQDSPNGNQPPD